MRAEFIRGICPPRLNRGVSWLGKKAVSLNLRRRAKDPAAWVIAVGGGIALVSGIVWLLLCAWMVFGTEEPGTLRQRLSEVSLALMLRLPEHWANITPPLTVLLCTLGLVVTCSISLVVGLRALRIEGRAARAATFVSTGLLSFMLLVGAPTVHYFYMAAKIRALEARSSETFSRIGERLREGQVAAGTHEKLWQLYAQSIYLEQGVPVEMITTKGEKLRYEPTASDVALRTRLVELRAKLRPPSGFLGLASALVVVSAAVGILSPVRRKA